MYWFPTKSLFGLYVSSTYDYSTMFLAPTILP